MRLVICVMIRCAIFSVPMIFLDLLVLLTFVWFSRKLFQIIRFPAMYGEIFAGLLAGPLILGIVGETEVIKFLAELGIFFLLFHAGLEANPYDLFHSSKRALLVAIGGMLLPFLGGFGVSQLFGFDLNTSLFIGLCLSITAVAITARLFKDSKITGSRVAHVVMAAAIMTEIIVLIAFAIFLDLNATGSINLEHLSLLILKFVIYFVVVFYIGHKYFKYLFRIIYKGNKGFTFSLILAFTMAVIAELIGLHFIIGAFLAGLFLHEEIFESKVFTKIEDRVFGLSYSFLGPIFFATLAFHLDFTALWTLPWFMLLLFLTALVGKVVGGGLPAYLGKMNSCQSLGVGLAMNSRGAVDLIVISIALQEGIIGSDIFSVLVIVAFASTFVSILGIRPLAPAIRRPNYQFSFVRKLLKMK